MGRGAEGRGRQDKRDWRQGARQPSLHIPSARVARKSQRVAVSKEAIDYSEEIMAPKLTGRPFQTPGPL